jgi:hypothetical protein
MDAARQREADRSTIENVSMSRSRCTLSFSLPLSSPILLKLHTTFDAIAQGAMQTGQHFVAGRLVARNATRARELSESGLPDPRGKSAGYDRSLNTPCAYGARIVSEKMEYSSAPRSRAINSANTSRPLARSRSPSRYIGRDKRDPT